MAALRSRYMAEPLIPSPGYGRLSANNILNLGRQLRDEWLYELPYMFVATSVYQQMASGRDYKVSGNPRGVTRCIEWMNGATTIQYDGIEFTGFDDLEKRRSLDHLAVGRTLMYAPLDGVLQYLDPTSTFYDAEKREWYSSLTSQKYPAADVIVNHAFPIGSSGSFMAPLLPVVSSGMLAYLVRDHDKASVDGRRIRDVIIVRGKDMADLAVKAMADMIKLYTEPDASKHNIPVIHYEDTGNSPMAAKDLVGRIGLSEIPENFNRADFEFSYVNEIAAALGISLRHFWNSEKATNRALEEVQEARQAQKGPSYFVHNEERLFNNKKIVKRFGRDVRVSFIEEVDVQSRETNAKVLKMYAEAVALLNGLAPGQIDIEALIGFMQRDDILPVDVELIKPGAPKTSVIAGSDPQTTPSKKKDLTQQSANPGPAIQKSFELDYDEITMDLNGRILERRRPTYSIEKALIREYQEDPEFQKTLRDEQDVITSSNLLEKAHQYNLEQFFASDSSQRLTVIEEQDEDVQERLKSITPTSKLNDNDNRLIANLLMRIWALDE